MAFILLARKAALVVLGLALAGCAREDGSRILGKWRAERLEVMSFKLPVGPELEVKPAALDMSGGVSIPIAAITQDGDEVTLDTPSLIGMTFYFVGDDRMYIDLPVVGPVYYRRVHEGAPTVAALPAPPVRAGQPQPVAPVPAVAQPASAPTPAPASAPAHVQDYQQALVLMRQGDHDNALRSLHAAFQHGLRDTALVESAPEFGALKDDVRYQALLARYAGQ